MARELELPKDFINRNTEQETFKALLQFNGQTRLLVIEDKGGTGKTALLALLKWQHKFQFPVSIIELDDPTLTSPFLFIERLRYDLGIEQTFEKFDKLNQARVGRVAAVFSPVAPVPITLIGNINASNMSVSGADNPMTAASLTYNANAEWSNAQEEEARRQCIKAFFEDVKLLFDKTPLVLLLDSYERCNGDLKTWLIDDFIRPLCFNLNTRPDRILLVLAGQKLPDFSSLLQAKYEQLVRTNAPLSGWDKEHVKEVLRVHDYDDLPEEYQQKVWEMVEMGRSIRAALAVAQTIKDELMKEK